MSFTFEPDALPSYVTEGALFMDAIDPEWFWIVNPETLDMAGFVSEGQCGCVLMQMDDGDYFPPHFGLKTTVDEIELGFYLAGWLAEGLYTELTRLWRDEINDRRAAALEGVS